MVNIGQNVYFAQGSGKTLQEKIHSSVLLIKQKYPGKGLILYYQQTRYYRALVLWISLYEGHHPLGGPLLATSPRRGHGIFHPPFPMMMSLIRPWRALMARKVSL